MLKAFPNKAITLFGGRLNLIKELHYYYYYIKIFKLLDLYILKVGKFINTHFQKKLSQNI